MNLTMLPRGPLAALALAAAAALAALPAHAQGTEEQQEACTPDALKLCQATIPDIPKTTACMKAHFAQLSPRCKLAFNDATGGGGKAEVPGTEGREAVSPPVGAEPDEATTAPERVPGLHSYEAQIRGYCRQGLIDPFTCRNTLDALHGIE